METKLFNEKTLENLKKHLEFLCKEKLQSIEIIRDCIYVFGSELACLRLEKKYKNYDKCYEGYSPGRKSHFFVITDVSEIISFN